MATVERERSPERIPYPDITFASYFPRTVITNEDFERAGIRTGKGFLTAEKIDKSVGVTLRFVADVSITGEEETQAYMAVQAAELLLGYEKKVDTVFIASSYPSGVNLAEHVREELQLETDATAEFGAACSGFAYMLNYIHKYNYRFKGQNLLLGASERYHPTLVNLLKNKEGGADPSLAQTIFSDGAVMM